ncbi:MAG: hypothetical protein AAB513_00970 [Patescibacteria group bacterium]
MNVNLHIKKSVKELETITKNAKRALFEVRVAQSIDDFKNGKFDVFNSAKDIILSIKNKK